MKSEETCLLDKLWFVALFQVLDIYFSEHGCLALWFELNNKP